MRFLAVTAALLALLGTADAGKKKAKKKTGTISGVISTKVETVTSITGGCDTTNPPQYPLLGDGAGHLAGVYVSLSRADGEPFLAAAVPKETVVIDQVDCLYRPKVTGVITGQPIEIRNSDPTFHNVRAKTASKTAFNLPHMKGAAPIIRDDLGGAGMVTLGCDVHPWMEAYVMVSDHAFFTVTGPDGKYTFKDVPPGKYKVHAWHPDLDRVDPKKVTVKKGKTAKASFSLDLDDCGAGC